jgi:hypothetical protein
MEDREEIVRRIAALEERREGTYDYIRGKAAEIETVLAALAPLAGQPFATEEAGL